MGLNPQTFLESWNEFTTQENYRKEPSGFCLHPVVSCRRCSWVERDGKVSCDHTFLIQDSHKLETFVTFWKKARWRTRLTDQTGPQTRAVTLILVHFMLLLTTYILVLHTLVFANIIWTCLPSCNLLNITVTSWKDQRQLWAYQCYRWDIKLSSNFMAGL